MFLNKSKLEAGRPFLTSGQAGAGSHEYNTLYQQCKIQPSVLDFTCQTHGDEAATLTLGFDSWWTIPIFVVWFVFIRQYPLRLGQ